MAKGGNANRQRMINLMYIVFIAMMALNVSSEVIDGFTKVDHALQQTITTSEAQNEELLMTMQSAYKQNPNKVDSWYAKAQGLSILADSLVAYMQTLKVSIVQRADGATADLTDIKRKDYIGAADEVLLGPIDRKGRYLRELLEQYRAEIIKIHPDSMMAHQLNGPLKTQSLLADLSWEEATFASMPTIAAVALLSKLQMDIRYAEGQTLSALIKSIDQGDLRVNQLTAQVIPDSRIVIKGMPYRAQIVMSAIDTTQAPLIEVNGRKIETGNIFTTTSSVAGTYPIKGFIEAKLPGGAVRREGFETSYTVVEPMATVAPTMMNVLYAGIDNPLNIAAPGVPSADLAATISSGTIERLGTGWVVRVPRADRDVTITVFARVNGTSSVMMGRTNLRVRALPDPTPYIPLFDDAGHTIRFKGGKISKQSLLKAGGIKAAIDDSILDVPYNVMRFQLVSFDSMGNAIPEVSLGASFSDRQIQQIRNASRGKRIYVTEVMAKGPDGIERRIPSIELIIN